MNFDTFLSRDNCAQNIRNKGKRGNRGRSDNFQIDGQDNNDNSVAGPSLFLTNVDAIGEYQVITNIFPLKSKSYWSNSHVSDPLR